MYLHCIKYSGVIHTNRGNWICGVLRAWNVKYSIFPVTRLSFSISKCIHSKTMSFPLMPGSFITMAICKTVYPESMHLVRNILTSIRISISREMKIVSSPENRVYLYYGANKRRQRMPYINQFNNNALMVIP